jgi:streptomycin 6-kinase
LAQFGASRSSSPPVLSRPESALSGGGRDENLRIEAVNLNAYEPWLTRWRLTPDGVPFETRFGSRLLPVRWRGEAAMLKIAAGGEERRGGALMAWYEGRGAARVFARRGEAILLERLRGERSLAALSRAGRDDEATALLCETAMALHAPRAKAPPRTLVPLKRWFQALAPAARSYGGVFARAHSAAAPLIATQADVVVLHGDFHHDNVLDGGERGWCVIDPKGLVGERAFEYANLFRNPSAEIALAPGVMRRRLEIVTAAAGLEPRRMLGWVLAYAGLGAAWSLQSGDDPGPGLAIAEMAAAELDR